MADILSLWQSPLDKVATRQAQAVSERQPRCSVGYGEDFSAMTIYNFGYYIQNYGPTADTALPKMLSDMAPGPHAFGGIGFIPQENFPVDTSSGAFNVPDQCNMMGSGGGGSDATVFFHFSIHGTGSKFLSCTGPYTTGGTYFHSLAFEWTGPTSPTDTCIYADTGNCSAIRCTFTNCPLAFSGQGPACGLEQCTIVYRNGPNGATAVVMAGSQCAVHGPGEFEQHPVNVGGPSGCTCISIQGGADHAVIANMHLSDWAIGVDFSQSGGSAFAQVRNCEIQSVQSALNIVVNGGGGSITGLKVTSCTLAKTNYSTMWDSTHSSVITIDPNGNPAASLSDITLLDCTVWNMDSAPPAGQYGLKIAGGTNIKVIGGTYSNNGGAGIGITAACGDVQVIGANLQPSYTNGVFSQPFALLVSTTPNGTVLVSGCDMRGYTLSPVSTSGVTGNLFINDCLGYNDQHTALNGGAVPYASLNAATCSTPYFGPSIVTFSNATPVTLHVFGQTLHLSFGVVFLPSPYDSFYFTTPSGTPTGFSWFGK